MTLHHFVTFTMNLESFMLICPADQGSIISSTVLILKSKEQILKRKIITIVIPVLVR